jgi:SAM-dependent methyltransferase
MKDALSDQERDKGIVKKISFDTYSTMKYSAMQNALMYQNVKVKEDPLVVGEERAHYIDTLFTATERYMGQMRELDRRCLSQTVYAESIYNELASVNDSMLESCARFEKEVNDKFIIKAAQADFREKTNPILSKSYCINRARTWPQGHQGDYQTLEIAYRNAPMSQGIGYYLDKYFLSSSLGVAVRERIIKLRDLLREELMNRQKPKVLDIACGSCREVSELALEIKTSAAKFTCTDSDADALKFAHNRLSYTGLSSDRVEFIKYNALRMFDYDSARAEFGMQDIIYSVGFFDYLPDEFLEKLLNTLYMLLNPGGKLIMAFKDANRYRPQDYHWLVEWDGFFQRVENDFDRVLRGAEIPTSALSVTRNETGSIIFYTAAKQAL